MRNHFILILAICIVASVSACSNTSVYYSVSSELQKQNDELGVKVNTANLLTPPPIYAEYFSPVDVFEHQFFRLSEAQQVHFFDYFNHPRLANIRPHERVAEYLLSFNKSFNYRGETFTASEALSNKAGNCMSLVMLTSAIADLADVKYRYRLIHSAPVFSEQNDIQFLSTHVNVILFDQDAATATVNRMVSSIVIDYFPEDGRISSARVSQDEVKIMYWHNLASEALIQGNVDLAFAYNLQANALNPLNPETLNIFAILYNRKGHEELAYTLYDFMVKHKIAAFTATDNFANLLIKRGEHKRANKLLASIKAITEDNPYTWINRGKLLYNEGRLNLAEAHFQIAIRKGTYLHEPYFFLANIYAKQHKIANARDALIKAESLAFLPEDERRYKAKLAGLLDR